MSTYYDFMVEAKYEGKWYNIDFHTKDIDGKLRHQYLATISRSFIGLLEDRVNGAWAISFDDLAESTQQLLLASTFEGREDSLRLERFYVAGNLDDFERLLNGPYQMEYYVTRNQIAAYEEQKIDEIYEYLTAHELLELPQAARSEYVLYRWNAKINNGDTVYILGDMAMRGKNNALLALVAQLKGKKILFRGNHDDLSDYRYQRLFEEITDYREIADSFDGKTYKLCLMHYPILMWNGQHRGSILLYAHTHNTVEEAFFQKCVKELNENKKLNVQQGKPIRAINVGCMMPYMGYEPRTLKEILSAHE